MKRKHFAISLNNLICHKLSQFNIKNQRYDSDGFMEAVPGCKRAVAEAIKILSSKGYEVVPFQPPDLDLVQEDFFRFMLADLGRNNLVRWKGEILDQSIEINNIVYKVPFWIRKTLGKLVFKYISPSMYRIAPCAHHFAGDLWNGIKEAEQRKEKILNAWNEAGVDVLICPGFLFPGNIFEKKLIRKISNSF